MTLKDLVDELTGYANVRAEIAFLTAKHQAAPKYLHEQAQRHIEKANRVAAQLDILLRLRP